MVDLMDNWKFWASLASWGYIALLLTLIFPIALEDKLIPLPDAISIPLLIIAILICFLILFEIGSQNKKDS